MFEDVLAGSRVSGMVLDFTGYYTNRKGLGIITYADQQHLYDPKHQARIQELDGINGHRVVMLTPAVTTE